VFLIPSETLVQGELLAQGEALVAATVTDKEMCRGPDGRRGGGARAKRGVWGDPAAIKNSESPGRYFAGIGIYAGRGQGLVRPAGWATTYLNFGRTGHGISL